MAQIGNGYGSEFHLLRYLGRHRNRLNKLIVADLCCNHVRWLDFRVGYDNHGKPHDAELKQVDFLPAGSPARKSWPEFWPQSGNQQNWDAVGIATFKHGDEWILVEAKAHKGELKSSCVASKEGGLALIEQSLNRTKLKLGVAGGQDWLKGYYQYCNRLALLNFLIEKGVSARLVFIYFIGDKFPDGSADCPKTADEWRSSLSHMDRHVGLPSNSPLKLRVHRLFLPVYPANGDNQA